MSKIQKSPLMFILLVLMLLVLVGGGVIRLGTISPGFEGAKCYGYGVDFRMNDWTGTYTLHRYQDAEYPLVTHSSPLGAWDRIYWASVATPNDMAIGWAAGAVATATFERPYLGVHVESNIQLQDINRQGDPLNWNITDPSSGRRIEYWSKTAVKEETADKVLYHYTVEKESFLVVPAEFWVGFYLVPSQANAGTSSGWREGEYSSIVVWFMLDWTVWDNAYKDPWLDDPQINVFTSEHEGQVINKERTPDYRGGFPIAGWIQGWEKAGWTSTPTYQESPLWYETRKGSEGNVYTIEELADLKDILMSKVQFAPSLIGQFISLYNEPSARFDYETQLYEGSTFPTETVTGYVKTPDSKMKKTMYFPINIQNFGTYADGDWYNGWRVFYPSCYFRMRVLYGVYGDFTYLWTEELAKDPTVNYPTEPERHGTTVISVKGAGSWFEGLAAWFTSPWTFLWTFIIFGFLILVTLIVLAVFAPGFLNAIGGLVGRKKGSARG